ncbi:hypothetical protein GCM10007036_12570 [Alsobacter metallidurans]|uniref:Uncharacterized protein n=1 Tax=Alsobacter metallidurans TaxID=340221 RepID=A0A917I5X5_9HYPH|nr:hypothetical protein [Alsobacter metallidurans]GGH13744.1 hypothetical protein GCM10007036_12570 [Alsobacter metallidurans]
MAVVLYLFAILLILAGGAVGLYGADNIRAESGAAWLHMGATLFAAGFVTLGLAAALRELKKIRLALTEIGDDLEPAKAPPAPARAPSPVETAAAPAFALAPQPSDEPAPPRQPAPIEPGEFERSIAEGAEPPSAVSVQEARAEDAPAPASPEEARAEEPAPARPEPEPEAAEPEAATPDAKPEPETESAPEPAAPAGPPTVVATYTSGGVQYFMYSDGGIEAEMEKGRYRFASMSELRRFVETGEGGELIAPASGQQAVADAANDAAEPDKASPAAS